MYWFDMQKDIVGNSQGWIAEYLTPFPPKKAGGAGAGGGVITTSGNCTLNNKILVNYCNRK